MRISPILATCICILVTAAVSYAQPAPAPMLSQSDGKSVGWTDWLTTHGSTVVVVWASWLPGEQRNLSLLNELRRAADARKFDFIVIALQEPIADSRDALEASGIPWLHDRHGAMLKHLLVYQIPAMAVVYKDGTVLARLSPDPEALTQWSDSQ